MPRDYKNPYNDDDGSSSGMADNFDAQSKDGGDEEHDHIEGKSYVVPKEICADMKVGDEMVVKIVGSDEDSYEIAYAPKDKGEDESDMDKEPEEGSMASYMR